MMKLFRKIFLNEAFVMAIVLLNAVVIYFQTSDMPWPWLVWVDIACTLLFLIEMFIKLREYGWRGYWSDGWNRMDGILVFLSLPSLATPFIEASGAFSIVLVLRLLRVLKSFRMMHFFPNFTQVVSGFRLAMRETRAVLMAFAVIIFILALINCALFKELAPEYFGTPLSAFYSVFRLFTVEGWYDIPDAIAAASSPVVAGWVRTYFCLLLIGGGIIGMSFINSIFVDAMAADNNDDVKAELADVKAELSAIRKLLEEKYPNTDAD